MRKIAVREAVFNKLHLRTFATIDKKSEFFIFDKLAAGILESGWYRRTIA